jgi:KaiC/GvpD/RAD55 family RecA-like ATPase
MQSPFANRGKPVIGSSKTILQQLQDTKHGEHNILIYPDLKTLNEVISKHYKEALENRNELALFVTYYQSIAEVRKVLGRDGLDVAKYEQEGSLVLYDSVKRYHTSEGIYSIMALINMLFERVKKVGKSGMFGMADMGSFFLLQRIEQLLSYERAVTPFNMGQDET